MNPINFPQQTNTYSKAQPQFRVLPVCEQPTETPGVFNRISKWELSDLEIQQIIATRSFYTNQLCSVLVPQLPQVCSPFGVCAITYQRLDATCYHFWVPMADGSTFDFNCDVKESIERLTEVTKLYPEQLCFIEKSSIGINEKGELTEL